MIYIITVQSRCYLASHIQLNQLACRDTNPQKTCTALSSSPSSSFCSEWEEQPRNCLGNQQSKAFSGKSANPGKSTEIQGNQQKSREINRNPGKSKEIQEIQRNQGNPEVSRNLGNPDISYRILACFGPLVNWCSYLAFKQNFVIADQKKKRGKRGCSKTNRANKVGHINFITTGAISNFFCFRL